MDQVTYRHVGLYYSKPADTSGSFGIYLSFCNALACIHIPLSHIWLWLRTALSLLAGSLATYFQFLSQYSQMTNSWKEVEAAFLCHRSVKNCLRSRQPSISHHQRIYGIQTSEVSLERCGPPVFIDVSVITHWLNQLSHEYSYFSPLCFPRT